MSKQFRDRDTAPGEGHVTGLLSAYIDDTLDPAEHSRVSKHIRTCPDCRAGYVELRATRQLLHSMPTLPPPRSFALTREMVAPPKPAPSFWQRLFAPRNAPRFAAGSVLSFVLLVLLLYGNTGGIMTAASPHAGSFSQIGSALGDAAPSSAQSNDRSAPPSAEAYRAAEATTTPAAAAAPAMGQPPAPAGTPASEPPGATGAASSGLSNPTTTALDTNKTKVAPEAGAPSGITPLQAPYTEPSQEGSIDLLPVVEVGLGLLGLALAFGALLAWLGHRP